MRRHFVLLLALFGWFIIQSVNGRRLEVSSQPCVGGIQGLPGIQMEFAKEAPQVSCLLGQARMEPGDMNRQIMREQQYLDFVFIPLYWAFFYFAIGGTLRNSSTQAGQALGKWLRLFISIAALADFMEDAAIFRALDPNYHGFLWPFPFGFAKWLFFFLALGSSVPLLRRYPKLGSFTVVPVRGIPVLHWLVGPFLLGGALLGVAATVGTIWNLGYLLQFALGVAGIGLIVLLLWFWKGERPEVSSRAATA